MEYLIEVAKILTKRRIARIEILDENALKNNSSLFAKFYEALITERINNDEDAADLLYGDKTKRGDSKYRKLKSRFQRRLYNTLFFIDMNSSTASSKEQANFHCNKEWAMIEIMLAYQAHKAALRQAKRTLTTALKFHLTDVVVKCTRILCENATREENTKEFEQYRALAEEYVPKLTAEIQAEHLYQQACLIYSAAHFEPENAERLNKLMDQIILLSKEIFSPTVHDFMYRVWALNLEIAREYDDLLSVCDQAVNFMQKHRDFFTAQDISFFFNKQMLTYLHQRNSLAGNQLANRVLADYYESGSDAWYDFKEYHILLLLHSSNYLQALSIFLQLSGMRSFSKLQVIRKDKWELIETFLNYLVQVGKLNPEHLSKQRQRTFDENEQELVNNEKDYKTNLAPIIMHRQILRILFLLLRRGSTSLTVQVDQLRKLLPYELKKADYKRARIFVQLLHRLEKADFEPTEIRNLNEQFSELKATPFRYRGKITEFEVIPYEKLWELLCEKL